MEILNFFREDPLIAWLVLLGLLLAIVSVASALWNRIYGRSRAEVAKQPVHETKPTRFGNQTELIILLAGILLLLAVIGWIRSTFFG
ncbi:MAG: hypothetical protein M1392_05405 [Gammaproteobacteria bacterium]|nr:hypothetical protein [Gammaproteobacteria bacterium]